MFQILNVPLITPLALTGAALISLNGLAATVTLENDRVAATWKTHDNMLWPDSLKDSAGGQKLALRGELFTLLLTNGAFIHATDFKLAGPVRTEPLAANPAASRFSERLAGEQLTAEMASRDGNMRVTWHGILREGSRYLRQQFIFKAEKKAVPLAGIMLLDMPLMGVHATGSVDGSPVATETAFFGVEHPLSINRGEMGHVRCFLPRGAPLLAGESYLCSSVAGLATKCQMRRDFLAYLERERAHPYRPFLHYNTWWDIAFGRGFDEKSCLDAIHAFGEELTVKRGVTLDSFMFDDGWDNPATLWQFDKTRFPDGFTAIRAAVEQYHSEPGIWLSPWGGYAAAKQQRLKYGREQGFEIRNGSFSMAGPKYYQRFRDLCVNVITNSGVNHFKFDGIGDRSRAGGGAQRDFDAMLKLIAELRSLKPDIYINQTTGTWPSPFWLLYADSIWRNGADDGFVAGTAPERERWITYRDSETHENIVRNSDLFPLNSLMVCGLIYAKAAHGLNYDTNNIFKSEVRSFFGSGTQLQEMYITASLLTQENWDELAEAAKWSRANADTLVDTHWIGGRPNRDQVYGWAAWSPRKGILTLRNPAATPQSIRIDPARAFELPGGAPKKFTVANPFPDQKVEVNELVAGTETEFQLRPFEVLVVEARP